MDHDRYRRATSAHTAVGLALNALTEARIEAATDNAEMYGVLVNTAIGRLRDALKELMVLPVPPKPPLRAAIGPRQEPPHAA